MLYVENFSLSTFFSFPPRLWLVVEQVVQYRFPLKTTLPVVFGTLRHVDSFQVVFVAVAFEQIEPCGLFDHFQDRIVPILNVEFADETFLAGHRVDAEETEAQVGHHV
jgi:hypothetical protein